MSAYFSVGMRVEAYGTYELNATFSSEFVIGRSGLKVYKSDTECLYSVYLIYV